MKNECLCVCVCTVYFIFYLIKIFFFSIPTNDNLSLTGSACEIYVYSSESRFSSCTRCNKKKKMVSFFISFEKNIKTRAANRRDVGVYFYGKGEKQIYFDRPGFVRIYFNYIKYGNEIRYFPRQDVRSVLLDKSVWNIRSNVSNANDVESDAKAMIRMTCRPVRSSRVRKKIRFNHIVCYTSKLTSDRVSRVLYFHAEHRHVTKGWPGVGQNILLATPLWLQ